MLFVWELFIFQSLFLTNSKIQNKDLSHLTFPGSEKVPMVFFDVCQSHWEGLAELVVVFSAAHL